MKQRKKKEQRGFRIKPNTILSLDHQLPFIKATRLSFTHEIGTDIFDFDLKSYFHNLELSYIQRPIHPDTDVYTLFDSAHDFPRYGEMDIIGYVDNNRQNQTVFLLPSPGHTLLVEHKGITIDVIYTSSTTVSDIVHFIYQFLCHVKVHDSDITTNNWKTYALRPLKTCCISKHNQNQTNSTTKHFVQNIMPPYLNGSCILSSILEDNAVVVFEKIMKNTDYSDSTSSSDIVSEDEIDFVVNMDNNSKVLVLVEIFTGEIYELFAFKDWTIAQLKREIFLTFSLRGATDPSTCLYLRRGLHEKILLSPTSLLRDVIELSDVAVILIERNPPPSLMLVSALSYDVPPPPVVLTVIVCTIDDRATYVTATTATFSVASTPELTPAHVAASFAGGLKTTTFILDKSPIPQKIGVLRYRTTPFPLDSSNTAFEIFSELNPNEKLFFMESTLSITNQRSFFIRNSSVVHLLHSSVAFAGLYSLDVFDVLAFVSKDVRIILHELSPTSTPRIIQVYSAHRLLFSKRKFFVGSTRIYDALFDFKRLGIIDSSLFVVAQNTSSSSHNPSLLQFDSPSYPPMVLLPNNNYTMSHLTNYRAKGRFPVVIWSGVHKQCLLRSSQPLPGTFGLTQCSDDVRILEKILKQTNKRVFYVYDARPKLSTKATRLQGGGMESQSNYPFCMFENLALDGIKEVKASFTKIMKIILFERRDVYDFKTSIESSGWLKSQHQLLTYAVVLANKLYSGESMLIHCRNGWDTTCSLCSLIMLMVDPFYRLLCVLYSFIYNIGTVEGFLVLIEHQWLAMGHKFPLRTGVGAKWDIDPLPFISSLYGVVKRVNTSCFVTDTDVVNGKAVAPIFLQFLEAIHHMICYDQSAFQFNDKLLVFIADCLYDSRFSTFYVEHTPDSISAGELYDAVLDNLDQYLNPTYKNNSDGFFPSFNTTEFDLWEEYFFRYPSNVIQIRPASVSLV